MKPVRPEMMAVFLATTEFAYYRMVHRTLKLGGFPPGKLLAGVRRDLELALALYKGHRRIAK